ncbi:MAG: hypothetical protein ACOYOI_01400 [Chthoniobacterales bacterium]
MLTRSEGLAKVSQIPGKTQLINFLRSTPHGLWWIFPATATRRSARRNGAPSAHSFPTTCRTAPTCSEHSC